jgi:hypothetical protein
MLKLIIGLLALLAICVVAGVVRKARGGRQLVTLEDSGQFITKLPKAEQEHPSWQTAVEALILVAESNGPTMFARIGIMQALNRHHVREFDPKHKEPHWGRRKLKRDQQKRFWSTLSRP